MQFIKDLQLIIEKDDLSKLPEDTIKAIKKLIRDGANTLDMKWANSLALVKKAYEIEGVEMASPAQKTAWEQYKKLLNFAVKELFDARKDFDNSWRMSSTVFREFKESMEKVCNFRVYELSDKAGKGWTVEAKNMDAVLDMIRKQAGGAGFDMDVEEHDSNSCTCSFSVHGIKKNYKVKLQRL